MDDRVTDHRSGQKLSLRKVKAGYIEELLLP